MYNSQHWLHFSTATTMKEEVTTSLQVPHWVPGNGLGKQMCWLIRDSSSNNNINFWTSSRGSHSCSSTRTSYWMSQTIRTTWQVGLWWCLHLQVSPLGYDLHLRMTDWTQHPQLQQVEEEEMVLHLFCPSWAGTWVHKFTRRVKRLNCFSKPR